MPHTQDQLNAAKAAYDRFKVATGGRAFNATKLPDFSMLGPSQVDGWVAAVDETVAEPEKEEEEETAPVKKKVFVKKKK